MSRWLAQGLSSLSQLREQASEFAQEVLSETKVETEDPIADLSAAKARISELESTLSSNANEIAVLKENNAHLNERAQSAEYQLHQIEQQKHEELSRFPQQLHSQSEGWTINLDSPPVPHGVPINLGQGYGSECNDELPLSPTSFQFEIRKLEDEIKQLQAECFHWKQLVKVKQADGEDPAEQVCKLLKEIETLKHKFTVSYEEHQDELLSLQEEHRNQLASLTSKYTAADAETRKAGKSSNWENDDWNSTWVEPTLESTEVIDQAELIELKQENLKLLSRLEELENRHENPVASVQENSFIDSLKNEKAALEKSLLDLDLQHQMALDQVIQSKTSLTETCQELRQQVDILTSTLNERDSRIQQLESETLELSDAYNDLNNQFEKQKQESGNVVSNNRELVNRLDALKGDLVEYEEKYERCKIENEKAVRQLEILTNEFDKLKQDLAQNRSIDDPRKWQEQILKLSCELEDSLKKREDLISNVGKFQEVVESFEEKVNRFRDDNARLRQENAELTETLAGLGDVKQTFTETDEELSEIRRSLKEYQLVYMKKELVWRQQVESLNDENENLKKQIDNLKETYSKSEHERLNGQLVKLSETNGSNGDSSYVHIEMVTDASKQAGGSDESKASSPIESNTGVESLLALLAKYRNRVGPDVVRQIETSLDELKSPDTWDDNWQSDSWEPDEPEHDAESLKISAEQQTDHVVEFDVQLKEVLESLNEKTEECEYLQKEIDLKRNELQEREQLVQQVFAELKGLEVQLNENRNHADVMNNLLNERNAELEHLKHEHSSRHTQIVQLENQLASALSSQCVQNSEDLSREMNSLQAENKNLTEQIASQHNQNEVVDSLQNQNEDLTRQIDSMKKQLEVEQKLLSANEANLNQLSNLQAENLVLQDKIVVLMKEIDEKQISFNAASVDINQLSDENQKLRNDNQILQQELSGLRKDIEGKQTLLENAELATHNDLLSIKKELDTRREENKNLHQQISALQKEIDEKQNSLHGILQSAESDKNQFNGEKQQLIVLINQKHEECVRYHQEMQRALQSLSEEQTKSEVMKRKLDSVTNKVTVDSFSQTDENKELNDKEEMYMRQLEKAHVDSEYLKALLEQKSVDVSRLEAKCANSTQQSSDAVDQLKRELNVAIQAKDRSTAELFAERQRSQKLVEQVNLLEESFQKSSKETERLRQHLVQIEEAYTNEAVKSEERETLLRKRLKEVEDQFLMQTESSKDGSQQLFEQLKDLTIQLEAIAEQRDSALLQLADEQIELEKSQRSLANLQNVLQHFQQERDTRVFGEVDKYKHEIEAMRQEKHNNEKLILDFQNQLKVSQDALMSANMIIDQISLKDEALQGIKNQLASAEDKCAKLQSHVIELQKVRDGKIDKDVLKNLLLGYFCAPTNKKPEVAHLLGSILGFTADEFKKSDSSTGGGGGWLQFLRMGSGAAHTEAARSAEQSLATQFIKFLETESLPKASPVPMPVLDSSSASMNVSRSSTPAVPGTFRLELPSFSGSEQIFEDSRRSQSSSDFLRDVLKNTENL